VVANLKNDDFWVSRRQPILRLPSSEGVFARSTIRDLETERFLLANYPTFDTGTGVQFIEIYH